MQSIGGTATRPDRFGVAVHRPPTQRRTEPFYDSLLAGLEERLDQDGATIFAQVTESVDDECDAYRRWRELELVDAVVVTDPVLDDVRLATCRELGLPVVILGEGVADAHVSVVRVDNDEAMRVAVDFLVSLGHTVIGRVTGPASLLHTRSRGRAFESATSAAGVVGHSLGGDYGAESGAAMTRALLTDVRPPTAIVFDNDVMAVAALGVAAELGLDVPGQLSVLAWDDSAQCRLSSPPLSVVSRDVHQLGEAVAQALLDTRRGVPAAVVPTPQARVVARGTTGPAPRG